MRPKWILALFVGFAVTCLGASESPSSPPAPASTVAPTLITSPSDDPQWRDLFAELSKPRARVSQFEERRHFPFRDKPVVLTGEIRLLPGHGLSLHYLEPKSQTLIVDSKGVLMRDDRGHQRAAPADSRAQAATSALFQILQFDVSGLQNTFEIRGRRDGANWTLTFTPKQSSLAETIGSVLVHGQELKLDRIELNRADNQRIEILVHHTLNDVIFPEDVMKRFFR